ncbi:HAMP domain-containing sensor histidine kinase [Streptomyces sp. NPDC089919]|uniref:sensor histidine kinase n=1 Tax=Streptomyces sp. NPDC089919 TaxID=3155188 RepID=UPI00342FF075
MADTRAGRDRFAAVAGLATLAVLGAGLAGLLLVSCLPSPPTGTTSEPGLFGRLLAQVEVSSGIGALLTACFVATVTWRLGGSARSRGAVTATAATALLLTFANARWLPGVVISGTGHGHTYVPWLALSVAVPLTALLVGATARATAPRRAKPVPPWQTTALPADETAPSGRSTVPALQEETAPPADPDRPYRLLVIGSVATALVAAAAWAVVLIVEPHPWWWNSTEALTRWLFTIGGGAAIGVTARVSTRLALQPVETLNRELQEITTSRALDRRITVPDVGALIPWLARTINVMLDRVFAGVARQQRFIADASHELRSPIANLRISLEASLAHPEKVDWPETVRDALTDIERLQYLTDDLLLLARLDDAAPTAGTPVDLAALAHDLVEEFRHLRAHQTLHFTFHTEGPVVVHGSAAQLERLLRNLLDNAARHARTVTDIAVTSGAGGSVRVEVRDDGPGIPPADRERVFERFTRLDIARARGTGGAGLGLAIAREIAARHGGTLRAAANPSGALLIATFPPGL